MLTLGSILWQWSLSRSIFLPIQGANGWWINSVNSIVSSKILFSFYSPGFVTLPCSCLILLSATDLCSYALNLGLMPSGVVLLPRFPLSVFNPALQFLGPWPVWMYYFPAFSAAVAVELGECPGTSKPWILNSYPFYFHFSKLNSLWPYVCFWMLSSVFM